MAGESPFRCFISYGVVGNTQTIWATDGTEAGTKSTGIKVDNFSFDIDRDSDYYYSLAL